MCVCIYHGYMHNSRRDDDDDYVAYILCQLCIHVFILTPKTCSPQSSSFELRGCASEYNCESKAIVKRKCWRDEDG